MHECRYRLFPLQWEAFLKDVWKSENKSFSWWLIVQNSARAVHCKGFLNQLPEACKSLVRCSTRAGPLLGYFIQIYTVFVQICIGSNTPVIVLLITSSNTWSRFPRWFSKKHVTINCLILTALLPSQSGGCKNVLWLFSREGCEWKEAA